MNPLNAAPNSSAPLNVALVDDEPLARSRVSRLLSALGCRVVGEFEDAEELLEALAAGLRPDALFLDIEMPGASRLEALAELPAPVPVVFITAYPEHAVRAFDTTAVDYILKPVYEDRLARALERVHQHRALRAAGQAGKPVAPTPARFPARAGGGHLFLEFRKVSHFELVDGAVFAWAGGQRFRSPWDSLAEVEGTFPDAGLLRIQRSLLVRPEAVIGHRSLPNGRARVRLADGKELEVSRSMTPRLRGILGLARGQQA
ncbi:MAG: response regulator transcription factor [Holophagaceae bacterium]|nr:response regulator transcription factor [Holophagaceae bacterium]